MNQISVLLVGESWEKQIIETKGVDTFSYSVYEEGCEYIKNALDTGEFKFSHMPCHKVQDDFPLSAEELKEEFDCVIISDCGANTFLLPAKTFLQCSPTPNKLEILRQYVETGGGLCMAGGYLSFMGIEGKGHYRHSPVETALPVNFQSGDDRMETPQGIEAEFNCNHPVLSGIEGPLPAILGYNQAESVKKEADVLVSYNGDPILSVMEYGAGRSAAYASDIAPHWCPEEFCESDTYKKLWQNLTKWLANQ